MKLPSIYLKKEVLKPLFLSFVYGAAVKSHIQFFRYIVTGTVSFIIDFIILYTLTESAHIHYLISAAIAFCVAVVVNYLMSAWWVFDHRRFQSRRVEFFMVAFIGIVGLLLNEVFLWFFTEIVLLYYLISKLIATFLVFWWNFFGRKFIVFREKRIKI